MAWELMANLWKRAGNVLLIFLLTLGADPACHHKYLAMEKIRDFVQLCLESDSKLILEALPGTLHTFGKQKIFQRKPCFYYAWDCYGRRKGNLWLTQKKRGIGAFAGIEQIIPGFNFVYFSPGTWIFMWEKIISELFTIYLFFIPSSAPHRMGDQLPVGSVNGPGGSWRKEVWPEHTAVLGNTAAVGWDTWSFLAVLSHPCLPCSALAPSGWLGTESPDCSFWSTFYRTRMKSQIQRVFPLIAASISPHLPISDGMSSATARVVPSLTTAVSSPHLLGFFPCSLGRTQESTGRKYLSSISLLWPKEKPRKAGSLGLSNATYPPPRHHTFLCEKAQLWSSKISQRWQGRTFRGTMLCTTCMGWWIPEEAKKNSPWEASDFIDCSNTNHV